MDVLFYTSSFHCLHFPLCEHLDIFQTHDFILLWAFLLFFSFPGSSGDAQHFALEPIPLLISMHCLIRNEWRKIRSAETGLTKPKSDDAECRLKSAFIKFHILMSNSCALFKSFCSYGFQSWKYMQSHKTPDISMPPQVQVSCQ